MIAGTDMEKDDVITILRKAYGTNQGLFNNAAQCYNHGYLYYIFLYTNIVIYSNHDNSFLLGLHET